VTMIQKNYETGYRNLMSKIKILPDISSIYKNQYI